VALRFLLDEHVPSLYRTELIRREPGLVVWRLGDPEAPPRGTPDPLILEWCERQEFVLVTNNRKSMPAHLLDHLAAGRHVPGIVLFEPRMGIGAVLDELNLIAIAATPDDLHDRVRYLPLR
jgi:hypothetical protein